MTSRNIGIFVFIIIVAAGFYHHYGSAEIITWDVYGYYIYLPAIFQFNDTAQFLFAFDHLEQYNISSSLYQIVDAEGVKSPIYTMGMALVYLPFYLLAQLVAIIFPGIPADGLSAPYQWSIIFCSWFYSGMGLYYARKLLLQLKLKDSVIGITLPAIFLGTNYFHYATYENGMPHTYLMTLYIILCYQTIRWHLKPDLRTAAGIGLVTGILFLIRPSEIVALVIPLGYGIFNGLSLLIKYNKIRIHISHFFIAFLVFTLMIFLQLMFWKVNLGVWVFNGYAGHHFDFLSPHIFDGLFSYRKGWLVYTPMAILALWGLTRIWKIDKRWFWVIIIYTILNIYIVLSWHIWWYASSFGMRALIQSFGVLIIPFAFFVEHFSNKKSMYKFILTAGISILIVFNQFQDWQYRNKILLKDEMTRTYYWKVFGKMTKDLQDRKYIDLDEIYAGNKTQTLTLLDYRSPVGTDTILPNDFGYTFRMEMKDSELKEGDWVNVSILVSQSSDSFGKCDQARLIQVIKNERESIKWRGLRFQYLLNEESVTSVDMEYKIPKHSGQDYIYECGIWNAGPDTIYLTRFVIEKVIN